MTHKYHAYGLGAALVDTEIEVMDHELEHLAIEKGLMTLVDKSRHQLLTDHFTSSGHLTISKKACGGSAANTLIALSYFGGKGFFSCKVADDENGEIYLKGLDEAGVNYPSNLVAQEGESGRCLVLITPDAERTMNTYLGVSESFSLENLDHQAIADSAYLYVEGYLVTSESGWAAARAAVNTAQSSGTKTALSLSDPGIVKHFKSGLRQVTETKGVDMLFCNLEEALAWTDTEDLNHAADVLKSSAHQFAITLGANGALLFDGEHYHNVSAHPVTAVDTNGAGDMFAGAFLYGLTQGNNFKHCGEFASLAAATVVSHFGPRLHPHQHRALLSDFSGKWQN